MALSGGVDSSVAAALLVKQGYSVTAAYMVNYDDRAYAKATAGKSEVASHAIARSATACWVPDYRDAVRVAAHLNIPIIKLDFTKEYKAKVLDYMFAEYNAGRTPNPDVLCNKFIKFGAWLEKAKQLGFDKLATGHYAQLGQKNLNSKSKTLNKTQFPVSNFQLLTAKDDNKDQTYFLHQLNCSQLSHVLFPLGNYTKPQVRKLAKKFSLATAEKEESMGICFVGEVPMKEFLAKEIKSEKGKIVLSSGEVVGEHDGLPFYTIGQRNLAIKTKANRPLYVLDKKPNTNELVVGYEDDPLLYKKDVEIIDVNWVGGKQPDFPLTCEARLRHRQSLQKVLVDKKKGKIILKFVAPQRAVTPGQFAVLYKNKECLGGGVIA